jgi:ArsR family transcriptional regulator
MEALAGANGAARVIADRPLGSRCCADGVAGVLDDTKAKELAELLQLLGHPVRLQLLSILTRRGGQVCVCDLEAALPVKQPTISHHLRLLRQAGLIDSERHGQWAYYFVAPEALSRVRSRLLDGLGTIG